MNNKVDFKVPNGFILFISGVPGVGKTTISYKLLKWFNEFRIIEETDILRDALRGYNEFLTIKLGLSLKSILEEIEIFPHTKLLTLEEAKNQCNIMKNSIENIVIRQQRKGISSIINGVHIIPEILKELANNPNILFINLFINNQNDLYSRLIKRDPDSYMLQHIPFIFETNIDLFNSTESMRDINQTSFFNVDITSLDIDEVLFEIVHCIQLKLQKE
ncbi:hypothetical protein D3Z58_15820 [Clostridiaceae bacterium]|nr:hypothetical protein [Clostridiaceae bacterium]